MKKIFLLCTLILCSLCIFANGVNIKNVYYILNDSTLTATVTYKGASPFDNTHYYNNITIPDTVQKKKDGPKYVVTEIGGGAFYGASCHRIILPNTITKIGISAFSSNHYLDSVVIPNSVTELEEKAFNYCTSLRSITLSSKIKEIKDRTFYECYKLDTIILPDKITKIGEYAFAKDSLLKYVYFPSSLDTIQNDAFYSCVSLTHVDLPQNLKFIGKYAFYSCSNLDSISMPDALTDIERRVFDRCKKLRYLHIPESVKRLGTWVTNECDSLIHIQYDAISCVVDKEGALKNEVTPFNRTSGGKRTKLSIGNNVMDIPDSLGYSLCGEIMLPKTLRSVGKCALNEFTILNDTLPSSLEEIKYHAFAGCMFPNGLVIPNDIELGVGAFSFIRSNIIKLPSNMQTIPDYAFSMARNLKNVNMYSSIDFDNENMINILEVPNSVTTIGKAALSGRLITLGNNVESLGEGVIPMFSNISHYDSYTDRAYYPLNDISIVSYSEEPPSWFPTDRELNSYMPIGNHITCYVPKGCINKYRNQSSYMWWRLRLKEIKEGGRIVYNTNNTIILKFLLDSTDNIFAYRISIQKIGYTIHEYTFDSIGNLITSPEIIVNQAPRFARHGNNQEISIELDDLEANSEYSYTFMALDNNMNLVQIFANKFVPSEVATNIDNYTCDYNSAPSKVVDKGNVYILMPNGKKYSMLGELIK